MEQLTEIPFGNNTITVYNKYITYDYKGREETTWVRQLVPNCFVTRQGGLVNQGNIIAQKEEMLIQIPLFDNFIEYFDWLRLDFETALTHLTVNESSVIVIRAITDEVEKGDVIDSSIISKYGSLAFNVSSVSLNNNEMFPIRHIAVRG